MSKVCQLFSGSKGNSIYIASSAGKFLVDAGVSAKRLDGALESIGVDPKELDAILITHEHSDHVCGLKVFATRHSIPVFAHPQVLDSMRYNGIITEKTQANAITGAVRIGGAEIIPFEQSHDSAACLGYRLNMSDSRCISVCTDTGYVTAQAKDAITGSDLVFLESNHETTMLQNGPYPYQLKKRILSPKGHLSNFAAAEFAAYLVQNGTTRIVLSHLSQENNTPDVAYQTTLSSLLSCGLKENFDFRLSVSAPVNTERPIVL